ncbi:hypothetical protein AVDCRST_MAG81-48 [uncultured Synechococcales cyanobacterium]|uniref:General secretion pathway GspH domain-containing protein n=1 Tax=uncultured Synechococcales cyanobacterium TaxID=1936017 RepID=A0A6J4ULB4_9CYAN|nr:hypothetical protein AVDCRST_MAG81-48 [uncultured Synechococcales cyanobacterium]
MVLFSARKSSQGFTLTEMLVIVAIVGILSAIVAPSFLGLLNRNKVSNAVVNLQGVLQEAQRESLRKSKTCTVNIPSSSNPTVTGPSGSSYCLITGDRVLKDISIRRDDTSLGTITFDFKGRTTTGGSDFQAIVFSVANDTSTPERCLMISNPLGVVRTGLYNDSSGSATTVDPNNSSTTPNCTISQ